MAPPEQQPVIQLAVDALRRLSGAPPVAQVARVAAQEIERAAARVPLEAILTGAASARAAFVDYLAGSRLLASARRGAGAPLLRIQRGAITRVIARLEDGSVDELDLVSAEAPADEARVAALRARQDELRAETAACESAREGAELALPGVLRRPPRRWNIVGWIARAVLSIFLRHRRAAALEARAALDGSRLRLAAADQEANDLAQRTEGARGRFGDKVRSLADGTGRAAEVLLELAVGPLPEGIALVDPAEGEVDLAGREPDALVLLGDAVARVSAGAGHPPQLFDDQRELCVALPGICAAARALRLGRRAHATLVTGIATLDEALARAEVGYQTRLDQLEGLRIADPDSLTASMIERLRSQIIERCHAVIRQTSAEVGRDLDRLAAGWTGAIAAATSTDELRSAGALVEEESREQVHALRESVVRMVSSGLVGGAHDLEAELLADLRARSEEAQRQVPPPPSPSIPLLLPSLAGEKAGLALGSAAPWLVSLFRSTETLRSDALEKMEAAAERLRKLTTAELLDAEPMMREALESTLSWSMAAALERHAAWLTRALAAEREAIEREREALAPLADLRDSVRRDEQRIREELAAISGGDQDS